MMRRIFALLLAFAGLAAGAQSAAAQSAITPAAQSTIALLPSGVTLRIHGLNSSITGVLYQQGIDSVWVRPLGTGPATRAMATSAITSVQRARPAYVRSVLMGTGLGAVLGALLYSVSSHNDHDIVIGGSVLAGAMAGLIFPRTDWISVPLH
jgi:hypothetical protein